MKKEGGFFGGKNSFGIWAGKGTPHRAHRLPGHRGRQKGLRGGETTRTGLFGRKKKAGKTKKIGKNVLRKPNSLKTKNPTKKKGSKNKTEEREGKRRDSCSLRRTGISLRGVTQSPVTEEGGKEKKRKGSYRKAICVRARIERSGGKDQQK